MTEGKLGSIHLGDIPLATKEFNVGVSPRRRKSARKPSSDINSVVGAKTEVPLDRSFRDVASLPESEYLYHVASMITISSTGTKIRRVDQK